jgi:hypothetical protein
MVLRLFVLLVSGYAVLCLLVFLLQRRMLYFPTRQAPETAVAAARALRLEPWRDDSGAILGWLSRHPSKKPQGTLLVLHGNAGSALDRTYLRDAFQAPGMALALDVVLLEYPGYGPRAGSPSEAALVAAAEDALDRLAWEHRDPVLLLGESLGSAAAALAAERHPERVKGLLLVTPLMSVPAIARRHYPFLPTLLARDRFRADRALAKLRLPVGFLVAGRDEVVFPDLGQALFETYSGPKRLWVEERAGHNNLDYAPSLPQWGEMAAFTIGARP